MMTMMMIMTMMMMMMMMMMTNMMIMMKMMMTMMMIMTTMMMMIMMLMTMMMMIMMLMTMMMMIMMLMTMMMMMMMIMTLIPKFRKAIFLSLFKNFLKPFISITMLIIKSIVLYFSSLAGLFLSRMFRILLLLTVCVTVGSHPVLTTKTAFLIFGDLVQTEVRF